MSRLISGFLWRFALVYALLIVPWPGFKALYGRGFQAVSQLLLGRDDRGWLVRFEPVPADLGHVLDTRIALIKREPGNLSTTVPGHYLEIDSRAIGWIPAALLVALVAATPVGWRRRARALGFGLFAVHAFVLCSLGVAIGHACAELGFITLPPVGKTLLAGLDETLVTQLGASFVVPVVIWVFVTIRRVDLPGWAQGGGRGPS